MQAEVRVMIEIVIDGKVVERREINSPIPPATVAGGSEPRPSAAGSQPPPTRSRNGDESGPPSTPLWIQQETVSESHPTSSAIARPQKPVTSRTCASSEYGWHRFIESVKADGDLWAGFEGLTAQQICESSGVRREVRCLNLIGVRDPLAVVLEHGPERCRQVREWAKKVKRSQGVTNEAGLVARTLSQGEPRVVKGGPRDRHRIG